MGTSQAGRRGPKHRPCPTTTTNTPSPQTDSSEKWKQRLDGLLARTLDVFFFNDIVVEPSCEAERNCNTDMKLFRGVLLRGLAAAAQYAPYTAARIDPKLRATARAAAASCSGGEGGRRCGFAWTAANFDDPKIKELHSPDLKKYLKE